MNYLITGGAGFIGRHLANKLVADGHNVRVLDDLSAGDKEALDSRVLFTRGDVRDQPKLWTLLHDIDVVFHLAAKVSLPQSILYPREYDDVNIGGTVALMEAMRARKSRSARYRATRSRSRSLAGSRRTGRARLGGRFISPRMRRMPRINPCTHCISPSASGSRRLGSAWG